MNFLFRCAALLGAAFAPFHTSPIQAQSETSALCENGECKPAISALDYQGRAAYKLTDGRAEAIIVPQIGRVMRFGKVGGPNLLWNAPTAPNPKDVWKNYGGDKTWLAPQSSWKRFHGVNNWPPDPAFDGSPQRAEVLSGGKLRLTTPLSVSGMRLTRVMYFAANGEFVIEQTARKEKGAPMRASIWSITQIAPSDAIFLPSATRSDYKDGFHSLTAPTEAQKVEAVKPNLLRVLTKNSGGGTKIGVDAPVASIASVRDGVAFVQKSTKPDGIYPEGVGGAGFPVELYSAGVANTPYSELEMLGPLKTFVVGGKSTRTIRWSLHGLPAKDVTSPAVLEAVQKLLFGGQRNASLQVQTLTKSTLTLASGLPPLATFENLPAVKEMRNFQVRQGINGHSINQARLQQLISSSQVVASDDPLLRMWHYAPGCEGSFEIKGKTYRFGVFLGGLGWLQTPDGKRGMFLKR